MELIDDVLRRLHIVGIVIPIARVVARANKFIELCFDARARGLSVRCVGTLGDGRQCKGGCAEREHWRDERRTQRCARK